MTVDLFSLTSSLVMLVLSITFCSRLERDSEKSSAKINLIKQHIFLWNLKMCQLG